MRKYSELRGRLRGSNRCLALGFENLEDRRCCAIASAGWDGPGKGSAVLNYYIGDTTASGMSHDQVSAAIKTALDAWSKVVDVKFVETSTPGLSRSLDFSFGRIDGSGGTLAQAYFPADVNPSRIAGDVQFDSSEKWEVGNALGSAAFDLVRVAVHEIGHALGLDHSSQASAVLAPTVSPSETFAGLDADDVDAIMSIYAPAKSTAATTPTSTSNTPATTTPPAMTTTPPANGTKPDTNPATPTTLPPTTTTPWTVWEGRRHHHSGRWNVDSTITNVRSGWVQFFSGMNRSAKPTSQAATSSDGQSDSNGTSKSGDIGTSLLQSGVLGGARPRWRTS